MFSSKEPSKYPGYMKYETRAKSFKGAAQWIEVKKEEFAKYGFLYHGMNNLIYSQFLQHIHTVKKIK